MACVVTGAVHPVGLFQWFEDGCSTSTHLWDVKKHFFGCYIAVYVWGVLQYDRVAGSTQLDYPITFGLLHDLTLECFTAICLLYYTGSCSVYGVCFGVKFVLIQLKDFALL